MVNDLYRSDYHPWTELLITGMIAMIMHACQESHVKHSLTLFNTYKVKKVSFWNKQIHLREKG